MARRSSHRDHRRSGTERSAPSDPGRSGVPGVLRPVRYKWSSARELSPARRRCRYNVNKSPRAGTRSLFPRRRPLPRTSTQPASASRVRDAVNGGNFARWRIQTDQRALRRYRRSPRCNRGIHRPCCQDPPCQNGHSGRACPYPTVPRRLH